MGERRLVTIQPEEVHVGGKPNPATPADRRLKQNKARKPRAKRSKGGKSKGKSK